MAPKTTVPQSAKQPSIWLWRSWRLTTLTSSSSTGQGCRGWTWPAPPTPSSGRRAGRCWKKTSRLGSSVQLGCPTIPWTTSTSCLRPVKWFHMFYKWNFIQSNRSHFLAVLKNCLQITQRYQQLELVKLCKEQRIHLQVARFAFHTLTWQLSTNFP